MCYVLSKATDRQPGSLNPGFPSPIRKMRPFCYRISKRKFLTCVLSTTYEFHRVKRSISLPRLANASERIRTLWPPPQPLTVSKLSNFHVRLPASAPWRLCGSKVPVWKDPDESGRFHNSSELRPRRTKYLRKSRRTSSGLPFFQRSTFSTFHVPQLSTAPALRLGGSAVQLVARIKQNRTISKFHETEPLRQRHLRRRLYKSFDFVGLIWPFRSCSLTNLFHRD